MVLRGLASEHPSRIRTPSSKHKTTINDLATLDLNVRGLPSHRQSQHCPNQCTIPHPFTPEDSMDSILLRTNFPRISVGDRRPTPNCIASTTTPLPLDRHSIAHAMSSSNQLYRFKVSVVHLSAMRESCHDCAQTSMACQILGNIVQDASIIGRDSAIIPFLFSMT